MHRNLYASLTSILLSASAAVAQPANDQCLQAITIACGQTVQGSTSTATADGNAINCVTNISAPGVWYSIVGTGDAITLSTCLNYGFDTKLNVYSGPCQALVCVAGNDDGGDCEQGSTVVFPSEVGVNYLVLVQGYDNSIGDFDLSVSCGPITQDHCPGAVPIACGESLSGSTENASLDAIAFCGTGIQAPGVWYTFTGISDPVTITTCESFDYDTRVNVYAGGCATLTCVGGNDDTPGSGTCSTFSFLPDENEQYHILVQGYDGATGNFQLELACLTCGTPTQVFAGAGDVNAYISWQSMNPGSTYVVEVGPIGFVPGSGTVTTGTVDSEDASAIINGLTAGTEYAFYLHEVCGDEDMSLRVGPLTFMTLTTPPAVNSVCSGALPLACGDSLVGNTMESFFLPGPTCGPANITARGLWYALVGNGGTVTVSTCGTASYDTKISVYNGACGDLECVAGGDDAPGCSGNTSRATFQTVAGETYSVFVHGYAQQSGDFLLTATCAPTCSPIANNDLCSGAQEIIPTAFGTCSPSSGNNVCAFASGAPNPPCTPYTPVVDVWYTFNTGSQTSFTVSLAALTANGVNAALYTQCDELTYLDCVPGVSGPWFLNNLETDTDYLIRVWNSGGPSAGSFAICIETDFSTGATTTGSTTLPLIHPNPARSVLFIDQLPSTVVQAQILDTQGRVISVVRTNGARNVQVDIQDLAPGAYLLRMVDPANPTISRFVKE